MLTFSSRRSPALCKNACVTCAQPLASNIGLDILKHGGNAADACVGMAAALNVTQPCSTGIGGDVFCLFYDAKAKRVSGLNGSGRSPSLLTIDKIHADGFSDQGNCLPVNHGHTVTVPGAAAAWVDTIDMFGNKKMSLGEILRPAIKLAEDGFPVNQIAALEWKLGEPLLKSATNLHGQDFLLNGKSPRMGEVLRLPNLAKTFQVLANGGKKAFYEGYIAEAVVETITKAGGVMTLEDLRNHRSTYDQPICVSYKDVKVWEMPPNGQGITALMALNILQDFNLSELGHNTSEYLHLLIEALRLSFSDSLYFCTDPTKFNIPTNGLLSKTYATQRRQLIKTDKILDECFRGSPVNSSDTVYLCAVDQEGNACSFINSNYMGFGTGLVPKGCGFTLQNRGLNFSLDPNHPNVVAPNKRPYHTIIPAMVTNQNGDLAATYGVMGGFMQPQGHVQVLLNMLEFGMNPQQAVDAPRFCIGSGHRGAVGCVSFEEGIDKQVVEDLRKKGHEVKGPLQDRKIFGKGHVIAKGAWWQKDKISNGRSTVLWGSADPRSDGLAIGY